jgi:hypothetical protein
MQPGHTDYFPVATHTSKDTGTYFLRTSGDGRVVGNVTIDGTLDVTGSAEILQSLTVGKPQPGDATLDVDGAGHFVDPGLDDPTNGGVKITHPSAAGVLDLGLTESTTTPGEYIGTVQVSSNGVALALNPELGHPVNIGSAAENSELNVFGDLAATGVIGSEVSVSAVADPNYAVLLNTGEVKMNGDLHIYAAGQIATTPEVHRLDSTPGSTDNYFAAAGGKVGFNGITTPGQQIDVSGNIQASAAILSGTFVKAFQTSSFSCGLFGGGDAVIPNGTNSITVTNELTTNMNFGARILLTYKLPTGAFPIGPADCGGGALTAAPGAGSFTIYSQNNITVPLPGLAGATVSYLITDLG